MNRRMRSSLSSSSSSYQRFLRPGALARLRDSRIRPRSASIGASQPSSPSPVAVDHPATAAPGSPPCFSARTFGRGSPRGKKLLAAKAIAFFASQSQAGVDSPAPDSVGVDLLVVH